MPLPPLNAPRRRSPRARQLAFRLAALLLLPLLALAALELGLRLAGYGYPTAFFLDKMCHGQRVLVENPGFAWRFMPPTLARSPLTLQFPADKPARGLRLLVLGESAALGDPEPAFGFARVLEQLLAARCPQREVEVVNTAILAINSHVIRELAREGARARADVWILYMGNNEVLGPYGLTTAFGARAPASPALAIRAGVQLRQLRLGQLLADLAARLGRPLPANARALQERLTSQPVTIDDPLLPRIYRHFEDNLRAVVRAGNRAGAHVLLNTMVANLKDCGPFLAGPKPPLPAPQRARWEQLLRDGRQALDTGDPRQALDRLNAAAALADRHADLQFQLGRPHLSPERGPHLSPERGLQSAVDMNAELQFQLGRAHLSPERGPHLSPERGLQSAVDVNAELQFQLGRAHLALGQTNQARRCLEAARDLDGFRARADSQLNQIIRRVAAQAGPAKVTLVDAERAFAAASPGGVPGEELLCDHVHFRFAGNYLLARLQAEALAAWLPAPTNMALPWLTPEECGRRLALTDWNRYRLALASRRQLATPLFRGQSNHPEREARLRRELLALEPAGQALESSARQLREAIAQTPGDWVLQDQLGKLLLAFGDRPGAAAAWSNVVASVPHAFMAHYQLGLLLNQPGAVGQAMDHLRIAAKLRPFVPEVHAALGRGWAYLQRPAAAEAEFRRALALDPENEAARIAWAEALEARQDFAAARVQLVQALAANTNSLTAHLRLARLLAGQGQSAAAAAHFREVLRLDPRHDEARRFFAETRDRAGEAARGAP